MKLDSGTPDGPIEKRWETHQLKLQLVSPANRRRFEIIVVGSGLAGASAAATLAELGYGVHCFCFQDSPRRAHSIAAQGGINAAKNYSGDGDSVMRLFLDTLKGGDYRSRESNVYRLAEISNRIIDQCVAQGVPFARDYGGQLDNRSFGGAQVSRTFYARGQTGQQLLLGACSGLLRQVQEGRVKLYPRTEMLDLVVSEGRARGIVTRNLCTGALQCHAADAVVLATGGYGNAFYLSTNARGCNVSAAFRAYQKGAGFANPCFTQIHPTCIPVSGPWQSKLTLMSESLRNDGRIWVPLQIGDPRSPRDIPESERDYYLERKYPGFGNLVPRDVASRAAKQVCDEGRGVGSSGLGVYLDFQTAIERSGTQTMTSRYGNLFQMYERITAENPYRMPMRIYPAVHYTMGGLWVDYNLMTTIEGCFAIGECNFSDHGANRLGASALMQGLADGYFILPLTVGDYLARHGRNSEGTDASIFMDSLHAVGDRISRLLGLHGSRSPDQYHRELGRLLWDGCGMTRSRSGLEAVLRRIPELRERFWQDIRILGTGHQLNQTLERALRIADHLEFAELLVRDALDREESCGGHFRVESQTGEGEAERDDERYAHVSVWECRGNQSPRRHVEPLTFEYGKPAPRSYQ